MWWVCSVNAIRPLRSGRGVLDPWLHGGTHRAKQEFTFFIARYGFSTKRGVGPLIRENRPSIGPIPTSRRSSSVGTPRARSVHPARHVSPTPRVPCVYPAFLPSRYLRQRAGPATHIPTRHCPPCDAISREHPTRRSQRRAPVVSIVIARVPPRLSASRTPLRC